MTNVVWHSVYSSICKPEMDILHLVERLLRRKIECVVQPSINDSAATTTSVKNIEDELKTKIKKRHMLLAMYVIFDSKDREKLLSIEEQKCAEKIMKEVNQGDEKTGIVLRVQNGMPQFLHRIFAKYLTACWLFENLKRFKTERIFHSQAIWSYPMKTTREFLDRLILRESEGCDLHKALVNKSDEQIRAILRNNPSAVNVKDMVGRLPLHLLGYTEYYVHEILGKMSPDLIGESDELYGWNALDYAFVLNDRALIRTLFKHGVKPNMDNLCQQVCSNEIHVLLEQEQRYTCLLVEDMKQNYLAEEISESVANYLIEVQKLDIYNPLAQLNSLSVLDKLITNDSVSLFCQLIRKTNYQALCLDDRVNGFLQLSLEKRAYKITFFLVKQHPSLLSTINDDRDLFLCAQSAIVHNEIESFKTMFRQFCIKQEIECVDEDNIIVEIFDQSEEAIEIPFEDCCCFQKSRKVPQHNLEGLFFVSINYGNIQMTSYILQKTKMDVTVELIEWIMKLLPRNCIVPISHKKYIPVFKFLLKKILDRYGVGKKGQNLFHKIIKHGCVYMMHSLIAIGFDPKQINMIEHWDVFEQCILSPNERYTANIFVAFQQRSYLDCFNTLGPTGKSIFDSAITIRRFIVAQALVQDKFHNLSYSEKENALLDLIQEMLLKHDEAEIVKFIENLLKESSIEGKMANEMWYTVYVSIQPQILQHVKYNRI